MSSYWGTSSSFLSAIEYTEQNRNIIIRYFLFGVPEICCQAETSGFPSKATASDPSSQAGEIWARISFLILPKPTWEAILRFYMPNVSVSTNDVPF